MPDKKDPGRFTVSFHLEDPIQREAAQAINRQGPRRKAQFIANAVSHYIHCMETPVLPSAVSAPTDYAAIEAVILQVLAERGLLQEQRKPKQISVPDLPEERQQEVRRQTEALIGERGMNAMQHTMAAFRRR